MFAGPGFFNLDASIKRTFALTDWLSLQFQGEAFGATNTPQYDNPSTSQSSSSFGLVDSSSKSRVFQFSGQVSVLTTSTRDLMSYSRAYAICRAAFVMLLALMSYSSGLMAQDEGGLR